MTIDVANRQTLSPEEIIDMRRRVLAGEEVTAEELHLALDVLALKRVTSSQGAATKAAKAGNINVKIDLQSAFAAFKQKQTGGSASADEAGTEEGNAS